MCQRISTYFWRIQTEKILLSEILSYIRTRSWLLDHTDVAPSTIRQVLSGTEVEVA